MDLDLEVEEEEEEDDSAWLDELNMNPFKKRIDYEYMNKSMNERTNDLFGSYSPKFPISMFIFYLIMMCYYKFGAVAKEEPN